MFMTVLAIGCHPDDIEVSCAGTLAKYKKQGHKVIMCHIANGNLGHKEIMPNELREVRGQEAKNSANVIGVELITTDISDLMVCDGQKEQRDKVVDVIRYANPDLIITHSPNDYMPDHIAVSKLVFDASFTATLNHYETSQKTISRLTPIYYMDTLTGLNFNPTEYVDITGTMEQKLSMLEMHISQMKWMRDHDDIDFAEFVTTCARYRGLQAGVKYAEAFTQCYAFPKVTTKRLLP
jgi:LmbE family N-acetylglucosaminyl deacetylase